ncbi:glycolate oxidase [Durotheca rogersii]|uniref:glycolate oxidase n=1 Tax=Durotheca rogersii TaxID=419775 RepID=UPI0022211C9D|nr:glycolate oxidase [Durotheca rogersii]KAI5861991.1 glycolate oxidase [Durotheca rogersii]
MYVSSFLTDVAELSLKMLFSGFVDEHPGGAGAILKCAGQDATESYDEVHDRGLVEETLPPESYLGNVDISTLPRRQSSEDTVEGQDGFPYPPLNAIVSLADFEAVAKKYLTSAGWAYYSSGADDEFSISDAFRIFRKMTMRPRVLRPVEPVSASTTILGCQSSLPVYFSPTGMGKYAHRDAEQIIAAVSGKENLIYCMPTSAPREAVFKARSVSDQRLFFQLYTGRNRERTKALIRNVEALGAAAIFLTVDTPVLGKRERDDRVRAAAGEDTISPTSGGVAKVSSRGLLNPLLSWDDLGWIRETTRLALVLKGVQTVEDAVLAYGRGVDGIVLSNHGGRSQDTAQAPILTLLEIRRHAPHLLSPEVRTKFQVFVDGGVRRGTDVIKAIALGATAVGIGRPVLYSMCAGYGDKGLRRLVQILRTEVETNMALAGARHVGELVPEMVNSERAEKEVSRRVKL